jgi:predicted nucleotidyltransferase
MDDLYKNKALFKGFSQDIQEVIQAVSFNHMNGLNLFGSMAIRSQQYASDYDLYQIVKLDDNNNIQALRKLAHGFRNIVANLLNHKKREQ